MKKAFLYIVLILLTVFIASAFFTEFYMPGISSLEVASAMRSSMNIILISCSLSWLVGSGIGVLLGLTCKAVRSTFLYILQTVKKIPAFILSAAIILIFGDSVFAILAATMAPVFLMSAEVAANNMIYIRGSAVADSMPQLGKVKFWKHYVFPMFAAPVMIAFLKGFRMLLYIDLSLGILGVMPSYTLGGIVSQISGGAVLPSVLALAVSVILIVLINVACLLADSLLPSRVTKTRDFTLKRVKR